MYRTPGATIISFNSGSQPADNEIFVLEQPITGAYELQPYGDFYLNTGKYKMIKLLLNEYIYRFAS